MPGQDRNTYGEYLRIKSQHPPWYWMELGSKLSAVWNATTSHYKKPKNRNSASRGRTTEEIRDTRMIWILSSMRVAGQASGLTGAGHEGAGAFFGPHVWELGIQDFKLAACGIRTIGC